MKKVIYFTPAIFGLVFYSLLTVFSGFGAIRPTVWLCIAMLFMSAVLLAKKKWFGCLHGILVGLLLIWMSFQSTGQVVYIERPLGVALTLFYMLSGVISYKSKLKPRLAPSRAIAVAFRCLWIAIHYGKSVFHQNAGVFILEGDMNSVVSR